MILITIILQKKSQKKSKTFVKQRSTCCQVSMKKCHDKLSSKRTYKIKKFGILPDKTKLVMTSFEAILSWQSLYITCLHDRFAWQKKYVRTLFLVAKMSEAFGKLRSNKISLLQHIYIKLQKQQQTCGHMFFCVF